MHDDTFHRRQTGRHMFSVGIRLQDVFALAIKALERAIYGGIQHVGDAQTGLGVDGQRPRPLLEQSRAHRAFFTWR